MNNVSNKAVTHTQEQVTNKSFNQDSIHKIQTFDLVKNVHRFLSKKSKLGQTKLKAVSAFTCKSIEFKKKK